MNILERALGAQVPRAIRKLLVITMLSVVGQWMMTAYLTIYVVTELPISAGTAGLLLALATGSGLLVGAAGGRISDAVGRRVVLMIGITSQALSAVLLLLIPGRTISGIASAALLAIGFTLRTTIQNALAGDLSTEETRDTTFALLRTVINVAAAIGPALGALLLLSDWWILWLVSLCISLASLALSRGLPSVRPYSSPEPGDEVTTISSVDTRAATRRGAITVAILASVVAWTAYNFFEIVLPVAMVHNYGLSPSLWGLLFLINPICVALFQVRLIAWTAAMTRGSKLLLANCLMGISFLILIATHDIIAIGCVIAVFTAGEILWQPTSQGLLTALAPHGLRGTVMGLLSSAATAGGALTSAGGLPLLAYAGPPATWSIVAVLGLFGGLLFGHASRANDQRISAPRLAAAAE
jgi:predicted MFS family arabinose efflux permease